MKMKSLVALATLSLVSFSASAKPPYLAKFKATYPAATVLHNCKTCHIGTGYKERNDYAKDFAANAYDFKAIEGFDSDVDGFTNIIEITAGTLPGDKDSHPTLPVPPTDPLPPTLPVPPTDPLPPTLPVPPTDPVPPTLPVPPTDPVPPTLPAPSTEETQPIE